jgi:hypothetical protein
MKFIIKCAWCGTIMGEKEVGEKSQETVITHSICPLCKVRVEKESEEFLNSNYKSDDG